MSRWHTTEFDFYPENAFRPRPCGRMTLEGGKGGGEADPKIGEALSQQAATANRMADFVMRSYEENKPTLAALQNLNSEVIRQQMGMSANAERRADDTYNFYKNVGRPMVEKSLEDAKNWDSEANIDAARGRATADVNAAIANSEGQQNRSLTRMGVNPNSGRMLAMNNQMTMAKTGLLAGAANNAGEQRRTQGAMMRQQAANIAQGMPAQSMGWGGQAGGFGSSAAGIGGNNLGQQMSVQGQAMNGMTQVGQMYGNNAAGWQNQWNGQAQADAASGAGWGSLIGTIGGAAIGKGFADGGRIGGGTAGHTGKNLGGEGGKIRGPGTGTSDQVTAVNGDQPIRLSNGEYIVSADVVKAKGVEFFDRLQQKYHTPVNVGRQ